MKKPVKVTESRWLIYHLKGTPASHIGSVLAPDAETAIKKAIEELEITDPQKQKRLLAVRQP